MNTSKNKTPNTGNTAPRPSLMGSAATAPSAMPDTRAALQSTRVLADLGGQKSSTRFKGATAALISGAVLVAAGSAYWASSRLSAPTTLPTAPQIAAAPPAANVPASVPAESSKPAPPVVVAVATAASPSAAAPTETGAARVIADEGNTAANSNPLAAVVPTPATTPAKTRNVAATGAHSSEPAKPSSVRVASAQGEPLREKPRAAARAATVAKAKDNVKSAAAVAKERNASSSRQARSTSAQLASKRADSDTDTDLLAAMLRRGSGNQ